MTRLAEVVAVALALTTRGRARRRPAYVLFARTGDRLRECGVLGLRVVFELFPRVFNVCGRTVFFVVEGEVGGL